MIFSEPLDASTVTNDSFALYSNGVELAKTLTRSADNTTVTLSGTWPASTEIAVVVSSDVRDLAGNSLADFESRFETSAATDTGRPSIVSQRPSGGATRVSPNTSIVFYASEPLDASTLDAGLVVSQNGALVPGTALLSTGGTVVEFTPDAPLVRNALIQAFLGPAITDVEGNDLNTYQSSFRIVPDPAAEIAFAESANPRSGATGVPPNALLEARFSEPLSAASVNASTVRLFPSGLAEAGGAVSLTDGGRVVRFVPTQPLSTNRSHTWQISGALGLDGGSVNYFATSFTTGDTDDVVAPAVNSISPPDGAVGVGVNARVTVRFSERVNPLTVTGDTVALAGPGGAVLPCTISFGDSDRTVVVEPHDPLTESALHQIFVSGVRDAAGNLVTPADASFTTRAGPDTVGPALVRYAPASGATGVPTNVRLRFEFGEPIDAGSVTSAAIQLYPSGLGPVTGVASAGADGRSITFVPSAPLAPNLSHSWYMTGVRDVTGNEVPYSAASFTTGGRRGRSGPAGAARESVDGATAIPTNVRISIEIDEAVSGVDLGGVVLRAGGLAVPANATLASGSRIVYVQPLLPLAPNTAHQLTIDGLRDLAGNTLAAPTVIGFTTGSGADFAPGSVTTWTPVQGATNVSTATVVTLNFSERVDPISVNGITFTLYDNGVGQYRAGTVVVAPDGRSATFTPSAPLRASASHSWFLNGATDLAGQGFNYAAASFTTGAGP